MSKPTIAWLYKDWISNDYRRDNDLYGGIGYYRVIKPAQFLSQWYDIEVIGAEISHWGTEDETFTRLGRDYDLIISSHFTDAKTGSNILATAEHYKKKVIADIDDNYLAVRKGTNAYKDFGDGKAGKYFVKAFVGLADGVTVSTEPLKDVYKKINKNIDVLPNCNDINDWPKLVKQDDGIIRIGFAGGTEHLVDLMMIAEPLGKILEKYPNVHFEVIGALGPKEARLVATAMLKVASTDVLKRFALIGGTLAWKGYPELITSRNWDIGICPLISDTFNEGKSHIKWMEYSMLGIPTVASQEYPFSQPIQGTDVIVHGQTGLFAQNKKQWFQCLETLVRNPDVRINLGSKSHEFVKDNWQWSQHISKWRTVIDKYL